MPRIAHITYVPGAFLNAELDKASDDNERQAFTLELADGAQAWRCADRRTHRAPHREASSNEGDRLAGGPAHRPHPFRQPRRRLSAQAAASPWSSVGQRAIAGETVLADLGIVRAGTRRQAQLRGLNAGLPILKTSASTGRGTSTAAPLQAGAGPLPAAQSHHASGPVQRHHGHPARRRRPLRTGGRRGHRCHRAGCGGWPARALSEGHVALWRRTRFTCRLREFRRGARRADLHVVAQ